MGIDRDTVLKAAALAGIKIVDEQAEKLVHDLDKIVDHFSLLQKADLPDIELPTQNVSTPLAKDIAASEMDREEALENALSTFENFFISPRVINDKSVPDD